MTGTELTTFVTGLNEGATVDPTLLTSLVQTAQTIIEEERPWMVLRKTNSALSLATSNTWTTTSSLSTITDFSRFREDAIITLFDGTNRKHYYRLVSRERHLEYKDDNSAFWYDANANAIYFGGTSPFSGTLYIPYIATSTLVDPTSATEIWSVFPDRFHPLLGFYAIGIFKGAVDYDEINRRMLPENRATMEALKRALEKWDNALQLSEVSHNDPNEPYAYPRSGAIDRYAS